MSGQQIGRDRRDDPEPQGPGQDAMVLARVIRQFPHLIQDRLRPCGDFLAGEGQRNEVSSALDELHAEFPLQFLDLHGKGRLRDGALIGRRPKCFMRASASKYRSCRSVIIVR